jgi:hypothetical protein
VCALPLDADQMLCARLLEKHSVARLLVSAMDQAFSTEDVTHKVMAVAHDPTLTAAAVELGSRLREDPACERDFWPMQVAAEVTAFVDAAYMAKIHHASQGEGEG